MKVGLDDYIVAQGPESLEALLAAAPPYASVAALHKLNEEVMIVRSMNRIVELNTGSVMTKGEFCDIAYAHRTHFEEQMTKDGVAKKVRVPTAATWVKWPGRATVARMVFKPGAPKVADDEFNMWEGWPHAPRAGSVAPWKKLLDYALQDLRPHEREWFEHWCAYPIQNPGAKMYTACVFYGLQEGTGKTLIGLTLKRLYGKHGSQIGQSALNDERNEWAVNKQFIIGDEVTGSDRFNMVDRLKGMISQEEMWVNQKYVPSYMVSDCVNYYFTSNRCNAFIMSSKDRRYFIVEMNRAPLAAEFYAEYERWLNDEGPSALMAHMMKMDLSTFNPAAKAPLTEAKQEMELLGRSDLDDWCANIADNVPTHKDVYTASELLAMFDSDGRSGVKLNTMGRALKIAGVWQPSKGLPFKYNGRSHRVYVVRNLEKWTKAKYGELVENNEHKWSKKYGT